LRTTLAPSVRRNRPIINVNRQFATLASEAAEGAAVSSWYGSTPNALSLPHPMSQRGTSAARQCACEQPRASMSTIQHYGRDISAAISRRSPALRIAFGLLAGATDAAALILLSIGTGMVYHRIAYGDVGIIRDFVQIGLLTALLYAIPNIYRSEYSVTKYIEFKKHPERILRLWNFSFVCLIALGFLTKTTDNYSRGWLVLFFLAGLPALILVHALLVRALAVGNQAGLIATRRLFLVGIESNVRDFIHRYRPWDLGLDIVGVAYLSKPAADGGPHAPVLDEELKAAVMRARAFDLDGVFVIVPWSDQETVNRCIEAFMTVPTSIHLGPERILDRFENVAIEKIGPVASLHLLRPPLSLLSVIFKRLFDFVVSATAVLVLLPLFLTVALLIKLDSPGPVWFLQRRYGFNQKPFRIFKFRTMTTLDDGATVRQATRNDSRVTRFGRILRRWNIDELPQLLNVLMGNMSLVGPRPHALAHDQAWGLNIALYARRHNVKPGITGWAQVNGFRGNINTDEQLRGRITCDLYYIDNWSIWLDLKILVATVFSPTSYRNAL
jgi:Undecaprenyl-phosphate glucose phosphotransferase